MNRMIRSCTIAVLFIIVVCACKTTQTEKGVDSFSTLIDNQPYQMRVRSGHFIMDRVIYETAYLELGQYLAISEKSFHKGTIEIIFAGRSSDSSYLDSSTDLATGSVLGNAWYIGSGYIGLSASDPNLGDDSTARSSIVLPEDVSMRISIKGSQGEKLWTADSKYKSGVERSIFTAESEEDAAVDAVKKIADSLKSDFRVKR